MRAFPVSVLFLILCTAPALAEPPGDEAAAPPARYLVNVESYLLRGADATVRALLGRCTPVAGGEVALLTDVGRERLLAAQRRGALEVLTSPRITLYDRQRGNVTILQQTSYVKDVEVEGEGDQRVVSPVVGVVNDGVTVDVRPFAAADGKQVTLDIAVTVSTLRKPMARVALSVAGRPFEIQVPEQTTWTARRILHLRPGTHGLFKAEGGTWALVTAKAIPASALSGAGEGAEIDLVPSNFVPPDVPPPPAR